MLVAHKINRATFREHGVRLFEKGGVMQEGDFEIPCSVVSCQVPA
jgi:hypothetical protein